jgi:hypothetical protein
VAPMECPSRNLTGTQQATSTYSAPPLPRKSLRK